jgi:hypothetical protein
MISLKGVIYNIEVRYQSGTRYERPLSGNEYRSEKRPVTSLKEMKNESNLGEGQGEYKSTRARPKAVPSHGSS